MADSYVSTVRLLLLLAGVLFGTTLRAQTSSVFDAPVVVEFGIDAASLSMAAMPSGETLVVATFDKRVQVLDVATGETIRELERLPENEAYLVTLRVSPDGRWAAASLASAKMVVWDMTTGEIVRTIDVVTPDTARVKAFSLSRFSQDSRHLIAWRAHEFQVIDVETGEVVSHFKEDQATFHHAEFDPDSANVLVYAVGKVLLRGEAGRYAIWRIRFRAGSLNGWVDVGEGSRFAIGGDRNRVAIYGDRRDTILQVNLANGAVEHRWLPIDAFGIAGTTFAEYHDPRSVLVSAARGRLYVWDTQTGALLDTLSTGLIIRGIEVSATGDYVAVLGVTSPIGPESKPRVLIYPFARETDVRETPVAGEGMLANVAVRPNPVRTNATVEFTISAPSPVSLSFVDLFGREIAILTEERFDAGRHEISIDVAALPPGTWFCRLVSKNGSIVKTIEIVR